MIQLDQRQGDVFEKLPEVAGNSMHGCLCDPPYGWDFMSRAWDRVDHEGDEMLEAAFEVLMPGCDAEAIRPVLWNLTWLREVHRVIVPGAYAVVFTGSKSYDLPAFASRLAGFEVLPMMTGLVGAAMAHGADVSKQIDCERKAAREEISRHKRGANTRTMGTANEWDIVSAPATPLAQSFDGYRTRYRDMLLPIAVLRKPDEGSYAANAARWGVGGFAIDASRVETTDSLGKPVRGGDNYCQGSGNARPWQQDPKALLRCEQAQAASIAKSESLGRHPSNVLLLDEAAEAEVGRQSGKTTSGFVAGGGRRLNHVYGGGSERRPSIPASMGNASRYFPRFRYTARAAKKERLRGCEGFLWIADPKDPHGWRRVESGEYLAQREKDIREHGKPKSGSSSRNTLQGTCHPTLKPLELCRWIARLILPPPGGEAERIRLETTGSSGRLLVPFSGVLSEAIGAAFAGWSEIVAVEKEETFIEQGAARWAAWGPFSPARADAIEGNGGMKAAAVDHRQGQLFGASP